MIKVTDAVVTLPGRGIPDIPQYCKNSAHTCMDEELEVQTPIMTRTGAALGHLARLMPGLVHIIILSRPEERGTIWGQDASVI